MSLVKIPLLLSSAVGVHVAFTPPNDPTPNEKIKANSREIFLNTVIALCGTVKVAFWLGVLGQSAATLIPLIPPSKLPTAALALLKALGGPESRPITPAFLAGTTLSSAAGLLRWACYRALGRLFTFHLSVRKDHRLVTDGPYSIVRHPSYTATALCVLGAFTMHGAPGSWLRSSGVADNMFVRGAALSWTAVTGMCAIMLFMRCPKEDEMMKREFGKEWEEWAGRQFNNADSSWAAK
ncbi:hypothetical protein SERLA73DRAFT_160444 [Serpula lacrymans var. lacrymans S7.3]|uniref:Protein-S-isoprenylcysteine O-methyltransferase n=2 Tax=Serpula lacrymans var. lacrymans TaxID=341189 RepID=F8PY10_SERL3|nr:uncharacterized protein SERLADRAFT_415491 [Serpula lacrymans var. lacrymans S7.9]EGN98773.1 hypothetical protein SERLA73DRAFT_160444 [Serpula lacrymans var. lacrymans S7.3]EGO24365.1 hypothetical protein SERLADRAFT_415491 [Serpula lacrymans var. lacrymans S7.9]